MRRFASDTLSARDIGFRFTAPDDEADIRLGADVRREVFLIFKECVNNVVRHSCSSEAEIDFGLNGDSISLIVRDNGKGFESSNDGQGHGMASMRERARSIGGLLEVETGTGGTTVRLHLQLGEKADGRMLSPIDVPANTGGDTPPETI
jgi:signal transduction histidine kinase